MSASAKGIKNPTHKLCSWIVEYCFPPQIHALRKAESQFGTIKPRDLEFIIPVPQLAGLLAYSPTPTAAFPITQWPNWQCASAYSDEIAQVFHLFPYSPQSPAAPTVSYSVFREIRYAHYITAVRI